MKSGILETKYGLVYCFKESDTLVSIDTLADRLLICHGVPNQVNLKATLTPEGWSLAGGIFRIDKHAFRIRSATEHCNRVIREEILKCLTSNNPGENP